MAIRKSRQFKVEKRISDTYDKDFKLPKSFYVMQKAYEDLEIGASPFENRNQYKEFLKQYRFSDKTRQNLINRYHISKDREEEVISQMEKRARSVQEGAYQAEKARIYKENLLKSLRENNDLSAVVDYRFGIDPASKRKNKQGETTAKLSTMQPITLEEFIEMVELMSLREADRLAKVSKDLIPDFRAFGSKQGALKADNIQNISMYLSSVGELTDEKKIIYGHLRDARKIIAHKKFNGIFYRTLPRETKALLRATPSISHKDLEMEKYWLLFKKDKLYYLTTSGRAYIPFVNKSQEKEIMDFIAKRLSDK